MRNKGFTMVELLVVIVIMGLITFLGFPALMRTLTTNSKKEFEVYGDSMIAGAKLYIQKEGYDLQASGKFNTGSITIPLKKLVDDGYISEFTSSKKGHRCDSSNSQSYVRITSETDTNTYIYKYRLVCNDGKKDITLTK